MISKQVLGYILGATCSLGAMSTALMAGNGIVEKGGRHHSSCSKHACKSKKDPIVGAYCQTIQRTTAGKDPLTVFANAVLNEGGTALFFTSADLQTDLADATAPIGLRITGTTATWKRIGKCRYEVVGTNVVVAPGCGEENPCAVGFLVVRVKSVGIVTLDPDGIHATTTITNSYYDINDEGLETQIAPPDTYIATSTRVVP